MEVSYCKYVLWSHEKWCMQKHLLIQFTEDVIAVIAWYFMDIYVEQMGHSSFEHPRFR